MPNVAVIGAGVIGLTSAIEIQQVPGVSVTIFANDFTPNLTSDIAAGLWGPYSFAATPEEKILEWGKATHDYVRELWNKGLTAKAGIGLIHVIQLSESDEEIPNWTKIPYGCTKLSDNTVKQFQKEHDLNYRQGFSYVTFVCEGTILLPYLMQTFLQIGGVIINQDIKKFEELKNFDVIVNCTGLYAKDLAGDEELYPVRGQVKRVVAPWQSFVLVNDNNHITPNLKNIILGGTRQKGDYDLTIRPEDIEFITNGCERMIPTLKSAELYAHKVGLRPGRDAIRLELEHFTIDGGKLLVVHNYGHGGSGITLSVGCAKEACDLVTNALKVRFSKL